MRVLVVSTPIFKLPCQGYSGLEHLAYLYAEGLAVRGHQVSLIAPDDSTCPGVEVISIGPERGIDEAGAFQRYQNRLHEFDVILDHSWNKFTVQARLEGKLRCPSLLWTHAPVNTMFGSLPPIEKPCFVCISEDQRQHFEALFGREARTCRNGVDIDFYRPLGCRRTDRYLFLARFSTIKGPDLAIDAALRTGVGLDMIGDTSITNEPEYLEECRKRSENTSPSWDNNKGKQIRLVGGVSRGETVYWHSQSYAMLHPNFRFREPLGLAPLESQLCQTPVIAWKYGAMKETVLHGETGFLVNSLDQMVELIRSDAVSTIKRQRCREWVCDNFSVKHMLDRCEELMLEAVNTGGW